jgi:SAM-dependent methyltransferase
MLRQRPAGAAPAVMAVAEDLPFGERSFDAAMAILTIHHWRDIAGGLSEMARVAERLVILSFDPLVHNSFWFFQDYLPEAAAPAPSYLMDLDQIAALVGADRIEVVDIPTDCIDGFNWAYWSRPEIYLDPEVRACMSGVALLDEALVAPAMAKLRADLEDGSWDRRHGELRDLPTIDGGFRLVIRDG